VSTDFLHVSGRVLTQPPPGVGGSALAVGADAARMTFGVLPGRALQRVVRESGGVTLAVAALAASGAVLAADSLRTELRGSVPLDQNVAAKIGRAGNCAVLLTGLATIEGRDLLAKITADLDGHHDMESAVSVVVEVMLEASRLLQPHVPELLAVNEKLWDVVLAVEERRGAWRYVRLWAHRGPDALESQVERLEPAPGEVRTVVLGAWHPELDRLDSGYADGYSDMAHTARAFRMPAPAAPRALPAGGLAAAVEAELRGAIATQELARRPEGWPADVPIAAEPVQLVSVGQPGVKARRWSIWR
jgi:hypothetical protein